MLSATKMAFRLTPTLIKVYRGGGGVLPKIVWNFNRFKEGIEERKIFWNMQEQTILVHVHVQLW